MGHKHDDKELKHDHDHDHDHHHNHAGDAHDAAPGALDDSGKLKILVEHWIKHNSDHKAALVEWGDKAVGMGHKDVSQALKKSAARLGESVEELRAALKLLD